MSDPLVSGAAVAANAVFTTPAVLCEGARAVQFIAIAGGDSFASADAFSVACQPLEGGTEYGDADNDSGLGTGDLEVSGSLNEVSAGIVTVLPADAVPEIGAHSIRGIFRAGSDGIESLTVRVRVVA